MLSEVVSKPTFLGAWELVARMWTRYVSLECYKSVSSPSFGTEVSWPSPSVTAAPPAGLVVN